MKLNKENIRTIAATLVRRCWALVPSNETCAKHVWVPLTAATMLLAAAAFF